MNVAASNHLYQPIRERSRSLRDLMKPLSSSSKDFLNSSDDSTRTVSTRSISSNGSTVSSMHSRTTSAAGESDSDVNNNSCSSKLDLGAQEEENQQQQHQQQQGPRSSLKRPNSKKKRDAENEPMSVQFGPTKVVGTIPCLSQVTSEERWETWWCPHEYQAIRLAAKYSTKQVRKCDTAAAESVQTSFQYALHVAEGCRQTAEDVQHEDESAYLALLQDPSQSSAYAQDSSSLNQWSTSKLPTRGLEKYVSLPHKKDRTKYMAESRMLVAQLSQEGTASDVQIAAHYHALSRYAHLFARFMGVADQAAAQQAYEHELSNTGERRRRLMQRSFSLDGNEDEGSVRSRISLDSHDSLAKTQLQRAAAATSAGGSSSSSGKAPETKSLASLLTLPDASVSPSVTQAPQQDGTSGGNSKRSHMTHLQRSFSRRNMLRRTQSQSVVSSSQAQQQQQQQQQEVGNTGVLGRSHSRRALLQRQESLRARQESLRAQAAAAVPQFPDLNRSDQASRTPGSSSTLSRAESSRALLSSSRSESTRALLSSRSGSRRSLLGGGSGNDGTSRRDSMGRMGSSRRLSSEKKKSSSTTTTDNATPLRSGNSSRTGSRRNSTSSTTSSTSAGTSSRSKLGGRSSSSRNLSPLDRTSSSRLRMTKRQSQRRLASTSTSPPQSPPPQDEQTAARASSSSRQEV